jgi:gliding motility-associated-like protein
MKGSFFLVIFFSLVLQSSLLEAQSYYALDFIENQGQWKENFKYKSTIGDGTVFIQPQGYTILKNDPSDFKAVMEYMHGHSPEKKIPVKIRANMLEGESERESPSKLILHSHAYTVQFKGSSTSPNFESDKFTGEVSNYFIGKDPTRWKKGVKSFGSIIQHDLYPGIDIRYYSNGNQMKYDFTIQPGADPSRIVMQYDGIEQLTVKNGDLIIKTSVGDSKELSPYAYQIINGQKKIVVCNYKIIGSQAKFNLKSYDPSVALIIDPILIFSTYTGSRASNWGFTAAPGPDGSLYAGGIVFGTGYPISTGAFQSTFAGGDGQANISGVDVSLTRFSPDGRARIFSTYLGGSGDEFPHSIYVDQQSNPVILGRTTSDNFPILNNNKVGPLGGTDIFVTKLSADGTALIGSVLVGGRGIDGANIDPSISPSPSSTLYNYGDNARSEVILDKANNVYIACSSQSDDFLTTSATLGYGGGQDGVLMKFSPDLSTLYFSTYLGGGNDDAAFVLALNPTNNDIYVAGATTSTNFPGDKTGTIGQANQGDIDGFVSIFSNSGVLQKTTYLGTRATDIIYGIQFDEKGFPYVMGISLGAWPVKNALFSNAGAKQFVSKLQPDLSDYVYSTVYGTAANVPNISPVAFLVDRCENVYVSGWGGKLNLCYESAFDQKTVGTSNMTITPDAIQKVTDNKDFYFFVMKKDATAQLYGSFFGQQGGEGDHVDGGTSRFDNKGAIYQAVCANCGGSNACDNDVIKSPMLISRGVVGPANGSLGSGSAGECNLAAFKINFEFDGVKAGLKTSIGGIEHDTAGCLPLTVDFTDSLSLGKTYEWNFGDGTPDSIVANPTLRHTYTFPGDFRARLISIDNSRCIPRDTSYVTIRVRTDKAILSASGGKVPPCDGLQVAFINASLPPSGGVFSDTSFVWDFGDNSPLLKTGVQDPPLHTYPAVGSYKAKLYLNDTAYCNAFDVIDIPLYLSPNVKASFTTPQVGCSPYNAVFKNMSVAGQIFTWNFGDGSPVYVGTTPTVHPYNTPGDYIVTLTATDITTCNVTDVFKDTITVKEGPLANFTFSPNPPAENTAVQFLNFSQNATRYSWDFGDFDTSALVNPVHLFQRTDTFNVCLFAYNNFGCADTLCKPVPALIRSIVDVPNAFIPNSEGINRTVKVQGFGIAKMDFRIYNRWGQLVFASSSPSYGWDGMYKGVLQPMDAYAYTLQVMFSDGTQVSKKGDITLIR